MNDRGANACREAVRAEMLATRGDRAITVTTAIPGTINFDSPRGYMCAHGITYWVDFP
jgi:hypothetical protein